MSARQLCIILATFNGAPWLREQIASIQAQTRKDWLLLVRDDGSTDTSVEIVQELSREDQRITLLPADGQSALGAAGNFSTLMQQALRSDHQLFFFCDQDDVWEPEKLERLAEAFPRGGEESYPMLAHCDMTIVNRHLQRLRPSMVRYMSLDIAPIQPLGYLLTRNFVTGCSAVANRELMELATPVPVDAIMHDWWVALLAAGCGKIQFVKKPLVKYRQHSQNAIGAKGFWHGLNPSRNWADGWRDGNAEFLSTLEQADALLRHAQHHPQWPPDARDRVATFTRILELGRFRRLITARKLRLRQGNLLLQLILYARLISIEGRGHRNG